MASHPPSTPPGEQTATIQRSLGPPTPAGPASPAPAAPPLPTGDPDRYQSAGEHARGGLGRVIRARDQALGRTVAVKELLQPSASAEARFVREALITARLQHPGVVPVHEAGRWPTGEPYYVMKLISGRSLKDLIAERGRLEERLALLPTVIAVAETIAYAHSEQVIHRDIKPANVMIGEFGETVVVDWGIAKDRRAPAARGDPEADPGATASAAPLATAGILGTPAYMSPEQARGEEVDERADVYALGALLYELLAGRAPYAGEPGSEPSRRDSGDVIERLLAGPPAPVDLLAPGAPVELVDVVAKAMARDRDARYPNAKQLAEDLERFQTGQLVSAHRYSTLTLIRRWTARHRGMVAAAVAALVAVGVIGALAFRSVVGERNLARAEGRRAEEARAAVEKQNLALHLINARSAMERDPTAAMAWLKQYRMDGPELPRVRAMIDDARASGVARHVFRLGGWAQDVTFSPDGRLVATAGGDGWVHLYDTDSGALAGGFRAAGPVHRIAFAPGGATLAAGDIAGAIYLVPVATLRAAPSLAGGPVLRAHQGGVEDLRYSADGRLLISIGMDARLVVWDAVTGTARLSLTGVVAVSPDAGLVAAVAAGGEQLEIHDLVAGTRTTLPAAPLGPLRTLVIGRAGPGTALRVASLDRGGTVRLYDPATRTARVLGEQPGIATNLQLSPSGRILVSMGDDRAIRVWDLAAGTHERLRGHDDNIYHVAFSADERVMISASDDATARVWDLASGASRALRGHEDDVYRVALSGDGRSIATASLDGTARVWPARVDDGRVLLGHGDAVGHVGVLPDGGALSYGWDGEVRIWDAELRTGRSVCRGPRAEKPPARSMVSADGRWVAVDQEAGIWVCELASGAARWLRGEHTMPTAMAFGADGRSLSVSYRDGHLARWDLAAGTATSLGALPASASIAAWAAGGGHFAVAVAGAIDLYDVGAGGLVQPPRRVGTGEGILLGLGFSADGRWLVAPARAHAHPLIEVATGTIRWLDTGGQTVIHIAFTRGGDQLAMAVADRTVRVWDLAGGGAARVLRGHQDLIHQVRFSPDGRALASASYDRTVRLWDLATGESRTLRGHGLSVDAVAFTADGHRLITGSRDRTLRIWDLAALPAGDPASLRAGLEQLTTASIVEDRPVTPET